MSLPTLRVLGMPLLAALGAVFVAALTPAARAEGPAVSDANWKIFSFGGGSSTSRNDDAIGGLAGSFSAPIAHSLGLQIDAAYARIEAGNFGSTGAHLFWRDPTVGLIGGYAGYARFDRFGGIDIGRVGGEAQYFTLKTTLDLAAGLKFGDINDQAYSRVRLQLYPVDDLMLRAGWVYEGRSFANLGFEYQLTTTPSMGLALYADANISTDNDYHVLGGFKVTFGQSMSLKDRHRRQDPDSYSSFDQITTQQAAQNRQRGQQGASQACPFTPAETFCDRGQLAPRFLPRIGTVTASNITRVGSRENSVGQCIGAGFTELSPGPAACGCADAFAACLD